MPELQTYTTFFIPTEGIPLDRFTFDIYTLADLYLSASVTGTADSVKWNEGGNYTFNTDAILTNASSNKYLINVYDNVPNSEKVVGVIEDKTDDGIEFKLSSFVSYSNNEPLTEIESLVNYGLYTGSSKWPTNAMIYATAFVNDKYYIKLTQPHPEFVIGSTMTFGNELFEQFSFSASKIEQPTQIVNQYIYLRPRQAMKDRGQGNISSINSAESYFINTGAIADRNKFYDINNSQIEVDFRYFDNHVFFGSAEKTFQIAYNKVNNYYTYSSSYNSTVSASYSNSIKDIITEMTPYENWVLNDANGWPKYSSSILYNPTYSSVVIWKADQLLSGSRYDAGNESFLRWQIPESYIDLFDKYDIMYNLLCMMGSYFDNIKIYIDQFPKLIHAYYQDYKIAPKKQLDSILRLLGLKINFNYSTAYLYEYLLGQYGYDNKEPLKDIIQEFYIRLINNVAYLHKTKGTRECLLALLRIFGIPETVLAPYEYGTAWNMDEGGMALIEDFFYSLQFSSYAVWDSYSSQITSGNLYTVEARFKFPTASTSTTNYTQSIWANQINTASAAFKALTIEAENYAFDDGTSSKYTMQGNLAYYYQQTKSTNDVTFLLDPTKYYTVYEQCTNAASRSAELTQNSSFQTWIAESDLDWWVEQVSSSNATISQHVSGVQLYSDGTSIAAITGAGVLGSHGNYRIGINVYNVPTGSVSVSSQNTGSIIGIITSPGYYVYEFTDPATATQSLVFSCNNSNCVLQNVSAQKYNSYPTISFGIIEKKNDLITQHISASVNLSGETGLYTGAFYLGGPVNLKSNASASTFKGLAHEFKFYRTALSKSVLEYHSKNPRSFAGSDTSSTQLLVAHWPMNEKYDLTTTASLKDSSPWNNAYCNSASLVGFVSTSNWKHNTEMIKGSTAFGPGSYVTNKVYIGQPEEAVLSNNKVNAMISPINIIDQDISDTFGNIDFNKVTVLPYDRYRNTYILTKNLREFYFAKWSEGYNYENFVNMAKFFQDVVYEYMKLVVPARTIIETGLEVRNTILYRAKQKINKIEIDEIPIRDDGIQRSPNLGGEEFSQEDGNLKGLSDSIGETYTYKDGNLSTIDNLVSSEHIAEKEGIYDVTMDGDNGEQFKTHYGPYYTGATNIIDFYNFGTGSADETPNFKWYKKRIIHKQMKHLFYARRILDAHRIDHTTASANANILYVNPSPIEPQ